MSPYVVRDNGRLTVPQRNHQFGLIFFDA